jgi:hypothetical protein
MKFQQALGEAITKDVLFMHVDCGVFLPYRWNPATLRVEWWSIKEDKWMVIDSEDSSGCEDWVVTERPRADYEKIVYQEN